MVTFKDEHGFLVEFSSKAEFGEAWHVLVLCQFQGKWVLTRHRERGLEFPGGKRERSETIEEAAIREVYEETGGVVGELLFLGQYRVHEPNRSFIKSIYYTELTAIEKKQEYLETDGPVLCVQLPKNIKTDTDYSFIMKDEIVPLSLQQIERVKKSTTF
ncbi:RNA deprotection pyrophosphohydrolase [Peribacillus asahii]|uniref:RNA deprotection pyrophosphohydrolase n=1 Tax=Peribacillus asahii TaxID=228899 RepID=UPI00382A8869